MDREFLAEVDPIIHQFQVDANGDYIFHPTSASYPLVLVDRAIDIFARVPHSGLQEAMKEMCDLFDLTYDVPEGWRMNGVAAFFMTFTGMQVNVMLDFSRHSTEGRNEVERDKRDYIIKLENMAERVYLCRILSGINVNMPVYRRRESDFVFAYDGKELSIQNVE